MGLDELKDKVMNEPDSGGADRRHSAILGPASVGLNAVALVWILPDLRFATALPPLTGTTRVMTTLSVGGPAGGMETPAAAWRHPAGRGVYPGSPSSRWSCP